MLCVIYVYLSLAFGVGESGPVMDLVQDICGKCIDYMIKQSSYVIPLRKAP